MSKNIFRARRITAVFGFGVALILTLFFANNSGKTPPTQTSDSIANAPISRTGDNSSEPFAKDILAKLPVKGRAPSTGYTREMFGNTWDIPGGGCDMRDQILQRDLTNVKLASDNCKVLSGDLADPYTGKNIAFTRGATTSSAVQIDHVVAIGDAWQTGAQQLSQSVREKMYLDPLELLAVDGPSNTQKSDGDAATWLPPNKAFRCQYVARQIAVKQKYSLWVTQSEHDAMANILATCPTERLPQP